VLFIWNKLPIAVTALIGLCAMLLFNIISFSDGFKNFGGSTVVLICSMMVVGKAALDTGIAVIIGDKVVSLAHGKERLVILYSTAITGVMSAFLSNIATLAIMISIITGVCTANKAVRFKNLIMPIGMAAVLGGSATLIGSTTQLTGDGILIEYLGSGNGFQFFTFAIPGFLIVFLNVLYAGFIGYPLGKRIWGNRDDYNSLPEGQSEKERIVPNKQKMILVSIIFLITVFLFMCCELIQNYIPAFNVGLVSLLSALACVLTGCISHKDAIKSINWSLAIWFCACLGIASGLSQSGGGKVLADWFIGLFGQDVSPLLLFAAFLILITVMTQFLSNSTVLSIVLPIVFSLTTNMNLNTFSFAVGLTMAAAMAVATPLANTTIAMTMVAEYKFSDYLKYGGPMTIIAVVVLLTLVPLLFALN
jgi:anion transporter